MYMYALCIMWHGVDESICSTCSRMFPWSYEFGRAVMALDFMVFTLRLIHIFAIHKQLGPKIIILGKMVRAEKVCRRVQGLEAGKQSQTIV